MKPLFAALLDSWRGAFRLLSDWLSRILSKGTVTLNIEGGSIRVLTTSGKRVTGWCSVPVAPGLVKDGLITAPAQVGSLIETLLSEKGLSRKRVIASLSGMRSVPRLLSLPSIAPASVQEAIRHESEREMPVPLDELYLGWRDLGVNGSERRFFVLGVPRVLLDAQVQALAYAGVESHVLDLRLMALARAANRKEAVIINLEPDNSDIVLVVEGVPMIMRTLIMGGEDVPLEHKVGQAAEEVIRTLEFYNSSHREHTVSSSVPAFLTGELAKDDALADLVRAAIPNPVEELETVMECPAELSVAEYAVNIGLALKAVAPRRARRDAAFPALDLAIGPDSHRASRLPMRSWLYALTAILAVALLLPSYQAKLGGEGEVARLELESSTLNQTLQDVGQRFDSINRMKIEAGRLKEEAQAIFGTSGDFGKRLEKISRALPPGIGLTSIALSGDAITLEGVATARSQAVDYAASLEETGLFSSIQIASLTMSGSGAESSILSFRIIASR